MQPHRPSSHFSVFRSSHCSWSVLFAAVAGVAAMEPPNLTGGYQRQQFVAVGRSPELPEPGPPQSTGPVSLTTELMPNEAATPLLPEGAENANVEAGSAIVASRRWTFSLDVRSIYDDNILLSQPGLEKSDFVFLVTPSVTWRNGDTAGKRQSYASASYSPSASFFVDESGENSLDHTVRADMQKRFGRFAVGVEGKYQHLSGATPELNDRVDRDEAGAKLRLRYDLSSRTGIETSAGMNTVRYREAMLADYDEWLSETFVGYEFSGRTRVGVGGAFGRMDVAGRDSQDFQRALVRATTDATGKLTIDAKGGVEFRQMGAGSETTPVFNVAADYRPTGRTSVGGSVFREVTASGTIENENVTRTGAAVRVQQKLGSRLTAGVEAGYEKMEFAPSESGVVSSGREDKYFYIRPSLRYEFREGRRAEIYYSLREDNSTVSNFDFEANQAGLAIGFDF